MDRSQIMEIRKLFVYKPGEMAFGSYAGCFINTDGEIKGRFSKKFQREDKNLMHKFIDIYKKTLSNNNSDVTFDKDDKTDGGIQYLLEKVRATLLENEAVIDILYEKVRDALKEMPNNYVFTAVYYAYDVPLKGKDKLKVDDASSELFPFIVCSLCPVKTQKGSLGYLTEKDLIGENPRLLVVDKPVFGFMYPAFNDRSSDMDAASVYRTEGFNISEQFFSHSVPDVVKEVKKKPVDTALGGSDALAETGAGVGYRASESRDVSAESSSDKLAGSVFSEKSYYSSGNASVPSLDSGTLSNDAHYVREQTIYDEDEERKDYSREPSDASIIGSSGTHHGAGAAPVKKRNRPVVIKGDKGRIRKQTINGVLCYVVAVEDAEMEMDSA